MAGPSAGCPIGREWGEGYCREAETVRLTGKRVSSTASALVDARSRRPTPLARFAPSPSQMLCCPDLPPGHRIMDTTKLTLRVDLGSGRALGPGKIRLLEAIEKTGSISQAGRKLGMSYRRAWLLVDDMNNCFREPVIEAQPGGAHGGGATLTSFGQKLVERYRAIEADALVASRKHLHDIEMALKATKATRPPTSLKRTVRGAATRR
jgi:molybdate transport system regulatory protein